MAGDVRRVFHGTTIAANAVIEHVPAKVGLITTAGFKYVLEIGHTTSLAEAICTAG